DLLIISSDTIRDLWCKKFHHKWRPPDSTSCGAKIFQVSHKHIYVQRFTILAKLKPARYNSAMVLTAKPPVKTRPGAAAITCPARADGTPAAHKIGADGR